MAGKLPATHRPLTRRALSILATQQARRLDKLGMSETMWDRLGEVHLARLAKSRGIIRAATDPTLCALYQRGLVTHSPTDAVDDPSVCLWTTTAKGKAMAMEGPE